MRCPPRETTSVADSGYCDLKTYFLKNSPAQDNWVLATCLGYRLFGVQDRVVLELGVAAKVGLEVLLAPLGRAHEVGIALALDRGKLDGCAFGGFQLGGTLSGIF